MKCEQLRQELDAIALTPPTELDDPEIVTHLAGCEACRHALREQQETWLLLSAQLPTEATDERLETRVFGQIDQRGKAALTQPSNHGRTANIARYVLAASVLFLLAGWTMTRLGQFPTGQSGNSDGELVSIRSIAEQMDKLENLERVFASPSVKYVSLATKSTESSGYLVHDPMSGQVHFFGRNLHANRSTLRVWLLDDEESVIASSIVDLKRDLGLGTALLSMDDTQKAEALIVTLEVERDAEFPSDAIIIRGVLNDF